MNAFRQTSMVTVLLTTMLLAGGTTTFAQQPAPSSQSLVGQTIVEIRIIGNETVPSETILRALTTSVGDTLTRAGLDRDVKAVYALGYFLHVEARTEALEEGARVVFEVRERPLVLKLAVLGNKEIPIDDIEGAIAFTAGSPADPHLIETSTEKIEDLYHDRGFPFVSVKREVVQSKEGYDLTYIISEGPRCRVKKVQVTGNETYSWLKIQSMMQTKPYFLFLEPGVYSATQLENDLLRIKRFYVDEGFLDARVARDIEYNAEKTQMTITVRIDEGPRYEIGKIAISGNTILTTEELYEDLEMLPGTNYTSARLDRDREALLDAYGNLGHIEAQVTPKTTFDTQAHRVNVEYDIVENNPLNVGLIDVVGNYKTKDKVIRRNLSFFPGQLFNRTQMNNSESRLKGMRFFDRVEFALAPGDDEETRDVRVDVIEARTGQFSFGVGVSSNSGLLGTISLLQRNFDVADLPKDAEEFFTGESFAGAGQQFALRVQPGTEYSEVSVELREPHVFDTNFSVSGMFFARERDYSYYNEDRVGGRFGLGRALTMNLTGQVFLRLEHIRISNVDPYYFPPDILDVEGSNRLIVVGTTLAQDTTNRYFLPTEGYRLSGSYELAGGSWRFNRIVLEGSEFWSTHTTMEGFKHVLGIHARAGWAWTYGGSDEVPVFERFFAGGSQSIRGFRFRGVGPHEIGDPVGGDMLLLYGAEYTVPVVGDALRGAAFWDGGGVWKEPGDFDVGELRNAVGLGLRIVIPALGNVPLSFDWAWVLSSETDDEEQVFSFNIGAFF